MIVFSKSLFVWTLIGLLEYQFQWSLSTSSTYFYIRSLLPAAEAFTSLSKRIHRDPLRISSINGEHITGNGNHEAELFSTPCTNGSRPRGRGDSYWESKSPSNHFHSITLSPLQIMCNTAWNEYAGIERVQSAYLERPVSLAEALDRMRQALAVLPAKLNTFVRIEQRLHKSTTDPLAWLDSQVTNEGRGKVISRAPLFYFGNQEGSTEVAVLGSVMMANQTEQVWELMPTLPKNTRWYGGEPFDKETLRRGAWKAWGDKAWWILPAVEILRESNRTTLAIHVNEESVEYVKSLLAHINYKQSEWSAPTTLPPILSRDGYLPDAQGSVQDGQDLYEQAVGAAIPRLSSDFQKVVLARPQRLHFGVQLGASSLLRRWKYGGHEGGHLFWMRPASETDSTENRTPDFVGCTPERLFRVHEQSVWTEALAGTRPRGSTAAADAQLCQELFDSPKDMAENQLTGDYIASTLEKMKKNGWVRFNHFHDGNTTTAVFVRRLRHLQHICHSYTAEVVEQDFILNVTKYLLQEMHPTPAVCGVPITKARRFIRDHESIGFDRGYYAGPVGFLGVENSDLVVAIRSGTIQHVPREEAPEASQVKSIMTLYAGAGIVPGSTVKGEWAETNYKLAVVASLFPQSPFSLQGSQTPNTAWAAAFVEELIRNGITQFYICPGSRSTPLVVAISRSLRSHLGIVHADSVHDERAAAFRALGYGRGTGKPAAVITSSGTAVANLYPAVVEASMDGVPMLLITADRPYESRSTGANQAIDQVGIFSSSYIRWSRDIPPPTDEIPISLVLSDVDHAVDISKRFRGPVHLNIQFRENLAPDAGKIRNDDRVDAITKFNPFHFTSSPKFQRWSSSGVQFTRYFSPAPPTDMSTFEVARLIERSKRGIIVVGNVRPSVSSDDHDDLLACMDVISSFAEYVGFPILAGVQSAALRFRSTAVVPFAEHVLRASIVRDHLKPDLVIQIGAPLVSTEIPNVIRKAFHSNDLNHVLLHPHSPTERFDPDFTVTHRISAEVLPWLLALRKSIKNPPTSELVSLIDVGRRLQSEMKSIIMDSASSVSAENHSSLSEPEIILSLAESISNAGRHALFLSNSMPIRDAEAFFYPLSSVDPAADPVDLVVVGTSRGASGIDGIIATAKGLAESSKCATTVLIGDVSALHDISSLHALANDAQSQRKNPGKIVSPLTTIIVNNDGGGIFSFLPIASHGNEVNFDEFFGTPTSSFNFKKGSEAFGVPCQVAADISVFMASYDRALKDGHHNMIEARVPGREANVRIHREISSRTNNFIENFVIPKRREDGNNSQKLFSRVRLYNGESSSQSMSSRRTLLLLHGWMGDGSDWDEVSRILADKLSGQWSIVLVDLPGHGSSFGDLSAKATRIRQSLGLVDQEASTQMNIETLAGLTLSFLKNFDGIDQVDAIAGYSLGGRVALAMRDLCEMDEFSGLLRNDTQIILLSSAPRTPRSPDTTLSAVESERTKKDDLMSRTIVQISRRALIRDVSVDDSHFIWFDFVDNWYKAQIWGDLRSREKFDQLLKRRSRALHRRSSDLAEVLRCCSPPRDYPSTTTVISRESTLFISGSEDEKYCSIGATLSEQKRAQFLIIPNVGHAVLSEAPKAVAETIADFLMAPNAGGWTMEPQQVETVLETPNANRVDQEDEKRILFDFSPFSVDLTNGSASSSDRHGIGWGENARANNTLSTRSGFLVEVRSPDGAAIALGEASPLEGVHIESYLDLSSTLGRMKTAIESNGDKFLEIDYARSLELDGYNSRCIADFFEPVWGARDFLRARSVYAATEMVLLNLASQKRGAPIFQALASARGIPMSELQTSIFLNGLVLRGNGDDCYSNKKQDLINHIVFSSIKVKVGHQNRKQDLEAVSDAFERTDIQAGRGYSNLRLDANRAWNESEAISFVTSLEGVDVRSLDRIEFIEEPLIKSNETSFASHVDNLERYYRHAGLQFALDESLAELAFSCNYNFSIMEPILLQSFPTPKGCAAFVLKPTVLGLELSMQLATLARAKLGIGAVFTSCFESGVAMAYISFLAALSDSIDSKAPIYAHGLGTFEMLCQDALHPPFASHVDTRGQLNVASLSRALYGLSLTELKQASHFERSLSTSRKMQSRERPTESTSSFDASTSRSDSEINFAVSLDLPFSSEIAHARFTDLPQQPRWTPWLSSVAYQGTQETEWKLNIRGIQLQWRAQSQVLYNPWPAIQWESISGLSNRGIVEFIPTSESTCEMKVRLTTRPPRILRPLFRGASIFLEDFVRDKLLRWSLEMFRDVVKADLALERGDVELGDALFGSVAGKAVAIEAALGSSRPSRRRFPSDGSVEE